MIERRALRRWLRLPVVLLAIYLLYAVALFVIQRRIIFPGQGRVAAAEAPSTENSELWKLNVDAGEVEALYLAPTVRGRDEAAPAVIFLHGNNELIDDWLHRLDEYRELGLAVLLVEFPGYGRSAGNPSEESLAALLAAAFDRLAARPDVDGKRIVAHGRSLGGGVACLLVDRRPVAAVILESSFTSLRGFAAEFWVPQILLRDPLDNQAVISRYPGPVLVFHGTQDGLVPHAHGEALSRAARQGRLVSLACGHNDCPPDERAYWREIREFLVAAGFVRSEAGAVKGSDQI